MLSVAVVRTQNFRKLDRGCYHPDILHLAEENSCVKGTPLSNSNR